MRAVNPFFTDPQGAAIGENIGTALFGDPAAAGQHALQKAKTALANQEFGGKESLAGLFEGFTPGSDVSPSFAANAVRGGVNGANLGALFLALNANNAGVGDDRVIRSLAGTGRTIGKDAAVSLGGQTRIRRDDERIGDERQGSANATSRANNADSITGAMERLIFEMANKPINAGVGDKVFLPPDHPLGDVLFGVPSATTAEGAILEGAQGGVPATPEALEVLRSGSSSATPAFGAGDLSKLDIEIARSLGAVNDEGNVRKGFDEAIGPERLDIARAAGANAFQQTRNFADAVRAAVQALDLGTGAAFDPGGIFSNPSITPGQRVAPASGGGVPAGAIDALRRNPDLSDQFDQKYGPGTAAKILGGA
jgi:hypothetical protein